MSPCPLPVWRVVFADLALVAAGAAAGIRARLAALLGLRRFGDGGRNRGDIALGRRGRPVGASGASGALPQAWQEPVRSPV
jgi:hypothetical protein